MLSDELIDIFTYITDQTGKMVSENVDKEDLTGEADYASVYSQSLEEFEQFTKELHASGHPYDSQPTGNYYWLNEPLHTILGTIKRARIRTPDEDHPERGYNDFQVKDFQAFKMKYVGKKNFSIIGNFAGEEMVELRDPRFNVRAYFLAKL